MKLELDRYLGAMFGLAAGDALGTTLEFKRPGSFEPVSDIVGGGPFELKAGEWTDDTSMAMCLAESLVNRRGFDPCDQIDRYRQWYRAGYWSCRDHCFDIGATVSSALVSYESTGEPFSGPTHERSAGNGSIMRLAPVPLYFAGEPGEAVRMAGESSRTTHGVRSCIDACRYFGGLIVGAVRGVAKEELLSPGYSPVPGLWDRESLCPEIQAIAEGSFREKEPPEIRGTGYVVDSLEAALWAFLHGGDFREGALLAVNLGDDADTTGAVYGQIAGACYGWSGIPDSWRERIAWSKQIRRLAEKLFEAAGAR